MFDPAFTFAGQGTSWLELIAVILAFVCVFYNVRENPIGWPFAIISSLLYTWLFSHHKLYGDAGVQIYFALAAAWAWWEWLFGQRHIRSLQGQELDVKLSISRLSRAGRWRTLAAWLILWPCLSLLLAKFTDSDVPYIDGFITAGSVVGQILLGRKFVENWLIWLVVNVSSIGMLIYKNLYLSAILYLAFVGMAVLGWRKWQEKISSAPGSGTA